MLTTIVDIQDFWAVIEYEVDAKVQRRLLPRELYPGSVKGVTVDLPDESLVYTIEFSDVDLPAVLGETLPGISVRELQDRLRRAGLWTSEDYRSNPRVVVGALQAMLGVNANRVIEAALTGLRGGNQ